VVGAAFVTALPQVLTHYSDSLTFLAQPGESGVGAAEFANYSYGAAIVLVILIAPGGLAGVLSGRSGRAAHARATVSGAVPGGTAPGPASPPGGGPDQNGPTGTTSSVTVNKEARHS
jgi:branched-chain amino acid transport system permease protein